MGICKCADCKQRRKDEKKALRDLGRNLRLREKKILHKKKAEGKQ